MSDAGIPEWLIGGPLHGKDRRTEWPDAKPHRIAVPTPCPASPVLESANHDDRPTTGQLVYARRQFAIGRTILTFWADSAMQDLEIGDRLAEILLAPHRDTDAE